MALARRAGVAAQYANAVAAADAREVVKMQSARARSLISRLLKFDASHVLWLAVAASTSRLRLSSAIVAAWCEMRPRMCGKPVLKFEMQRIPTLWWLRPVSRAARVGEHSGVTWKFV